MMTRNLLTTIAGAACAMWIAAPALAVLPDDVRKGTRVEAEGQRLDDSSFTAEEVEIHARFAGKDEIKGRVTAVDAADRTLRIHGVDVRVAKDAEIQDADGAAIELSSFAVGQYAEIEGVYRGGALHADEVERGEPDPGEELKVELAGIITQVDRAGSSFQIMGIEVLVTPRTVIEMK
jgi:hypothetical protein